MLLLQFRKWYSWESVVFMQYFFHVIFVTMLLELRGIEAFKYGFERGEDNNKWQTITDEAFIIISASEHNFSTLYPQTDTTLGTSKGHYAIANYTEGQKNESRRLFHNCQGPTGPLCRLNFTAIIHTLFPLAVATRFRCDNCEIGTPSTDRRHILHTYGNYSDTRWRSYSLLLGSHPVTFDIEFITAVSEENNFVAIDDLELVDCEPEIADGFCPESRRNKCDGALGCLSRDQLCDLHKDCMCGSDERDCESMQSHPEGYLNLEGCDFESRECLWYNAYPDSSSNNNKNSFQWRVVDNTERHEHTADSSSHLPVKHLAVSTSHYTPEAAVAVLRSVLFHPQFTESATCQVRFWYMSTVKDMVVKLELVKVPFNSQPRSLVTLWETVTNETRSSSGPDDISDQELWNRVVAEVSDSSFNNSYILQFKVYPNNHSRVQPAGDVSIHSVSLSPDCFTPDVILTSCGVRGDRGPGQRDCDLYYGQEDLVRVLKQGRFVGAQEWTVPDSGIYRLQVTGSRGGNILNSVDIMANARGSSIITKFRLVKGDKLYFLIGQPGEDDCQTAHDEDMNIKPEKEMVGGGGGGGATIVFKMNNRNKTQVLIVAGGGGGLPIKTSQERGQVPNNATIMSDKEAELFLSGSLRGSAPCQDSTNNIHFCRGKGGFGAGGGACIGGGHGGGAKKIRLQAKVNLTRTGVGQPGRSYLHSSALYYSILADSHWGPGFVKIFSEEDFGCEYMCSFPEINSVKPTSVCPSKGIVSACQEAVVKEKEEASYVFLVVLVGALLVTFLSIICMCLYMQRHTVRSRHPTNVKKVASFLCPCIDLSHRALSLSAHVLPQIQRPPAIMHVNPNYDVVTTKCPEQSLKELPRKHLKLMNALGQGAFGEVYYGLLSNVPLVDGDLPVAVKTLSAMCTEQTEMDFLMEAVIVSKFNHPNIVKFIGVCFDQQPHYLVLELLEGGDLKSFLRQARPKWDQPSSLTVLDLLRLCLDVARGCQHLEDKHFIHRDIAARNCLLTTKGPNRTAKIADFGMARDIYRSDYYKKSGKAMLPVKWMPPEAFLDGIFTSKTDVWSFGILMWEVFSLGHMPYPGCSNEEVMNLVTQGGCLDPPESCPSAIFDIMASCWSALPEGRPNFSLIIASLERTLQDDDMVSRGLPVFYVPPIINTRGLRLQDPQTHNPAQPKASTKGTASPHNIAMVPNISGDGYLEPLLTPSSRSDSHSNFNSCAESKMSSRSLRDFANSRVFIDSGKPTNKISCRTPRVFYKPGSSHLHSQDAAASESLISSQNSSRNYCLPQKDEEGMHSDQKFDLHVSINGNHSEKDGHHNDIEDLDNEDFKLSQGGASEHRHKSYTDFPAPPI